MMNKRIPALSISIVLVLVLATFSSAAAAPAKYVHIEAHEYIGQNGEPFSASGPAVDAGLVCASGTTEEVEIYPGHSAGSLSFFGVLKRFHCTGGGSFDVQLNVRLNTVTHGTTASWSVVGGTGAYASLRASGSLVGTPGDVPGDDIYDTYNGIAR
jgi:hypothetical protein